MSINGPKSLISRLKRRPENFYVIHYSCQNLNDNNEGLSPRITSIAVVHFATDQVISFSAHIVAELLGIERAEVAERYDEVEKGLLEQFYAFAGERRDRHWVHWNMRSSTYGFEHLEHRYRCLAGIAPPVVPVERRINLNDMLARRYGPNYVPHPRMVNLMELNGGLGKDFLPGAEEVKAFSNGEFIKLHKSVIAKVGFFTSALRKMVTGRLKTASSGWGQKIDSALESRLSKSIAVVAAILGLVGGVTTLINIFW